MSTSTGTTPVCGYCGKPVINAGVWHLGIAYHAECTMAEYEKPEIIRAPELLAFVAEKDKRIADLERQLAEKQDEQIKMTAAAIAHRACCGTEHAPMEGKLHGYCVVCGVPWPCETASIFLFARKPK